jgi:hypothetical protein
MKNLSIALLLSIASFQVFSKPVCVIKPVDGFEEVYGKATFLEDNESKSQSVVAFTPEMAKDIGLILSSGLRDKCAGIEIMDIPRPNQYEKTQASSDTVQTVVYEYDVSWNASIQKIAGNYSVTTGPTFKVFKWNQVVCHNMRVPYTYIIGGDQSIEEVFLDANQKNLDQITNDVYECEL